MTPNTQGLLVNGWPSNFVVMADGGAAPISIEDLQIQMHDLTSRVAQLQNSIDAEGRSATPEEIKMRNELMDEFDRSEKELQARMRMQAQEARLAESAGRAVPPAQPGAAAEPQNMATPNTAAFAAAVPAPARNDRSSATHYEVGQPGYYRTGGFHNLGEFARAVFNANPRVAQAVDKRLIQIQNAPSQYGSEGVDADGGYAVPPDFRAEIMRKVLGEESIVRMTDEQTTSSKSMTFPMDNTTPWQSTGGIQTYWTGEGKKFTESKPLLAPGEIKLHKLAALVPMTEELLEDAPAMDGYLSSKVPEKMGFALDDAIINGDGTGKPLGILKSGALLTVDPTAGQAADTVTYENILDMQTAMYSRGRNRGVWLTNPSMIKTLALMTFPSGNTVVPVYLPANGAAGRPFATVLGNPVHETEACADTGDVGDIIYADLSKYATLTRRGRGLRVDTSIHLYFDYDVQAFRFILRFGGQPWWDAPILGKNGVTAYSAFVALAERA